MTVYFGGHLFVIRQLERQEESVLLPRIFDPDVKKIVDWDRKWKTPINSHYLSKLLNKKNEDSR